MSDVKCPLCGGYVVIVKATHTAIWYVCPKDEYAFCKHYMLLEEPKLEEKPKCAGCCQRGVVQEVSSAHGVG